MNKAPVSLREVVLWAITVLLAIHTTWFVSVGLGYGDNWPLLIVIVPLAFVGLSIVSLVKRRYSRSYLASIYATGIVMALFYGIVASGLAQDASGHVCTGFFNVTVTCSSEALQFVELSSWLVIWPLSILYVVAGVLQVRHMRRISR